MSRIKRALPAVVLAGALVLGAPAAEAAFPGKNGKLFFTREKAAKGQIFSVNPDGSKARAVSPRDRYDASQAAVSRDGKRIVFQSYRNGNSELYLMRSDGSGVKRLTKTPKTYELEPSWAPNGRSIVYHAGRKNSPEQDIYVIGVNGRGRKRLTTAPGSDSEAAWSPNGKLIAFQSNRVGSDGFDTYVMNANGTGQHEVTRLANDEGEPVWSPDGQRLAISPAIFIPTLNQVRDEIFTVRIDGTEVTRLTTNDVYDYTPAWSPDGKRIAFVSDRTGNFDVYTMDAFTGGNVRRVTSSPRTDTHVEWAVR